MLSLQTLEQIQDYCQEMFVSNIVMLKETKSVILRRLMEDKLVKIFKSLILKLKIGTEWFVF